jgi:hypothetical protein
MPGRNGYSGAKQHTHLADYPQELDDAGDGGAIAPNGDATVRIVTVEAGAGETRTLRDPLFIGQKLDIVFETDRGSVTITADSAVNQAGNTSILGEDAGDHLFLMGARDGAGDFEWRVVKNDGFTLS